MAARVAIIGGGWSGLACAVRLTEARHAITLFEAADTLGGRARGLTLDDKKIDNGQHILIGAYTETLSLLSTVGVDEKRALLRMPLTLHFPGALKLAAPKLPSPFHTLAALLSARGLSVGEKFAAARFMAHLAAIQYQPAQPTVRSLLDATGQPPRLIRLLWEPLCVAAVNTPIEDACAKSFCAVLRDALTGPRAHSDLLLPRTDLTALFPDPARRWLTERGGLVHTGTRVAAIARDDAGMLLKIDEEWQRFDQVVVATSPHHAAKLLAGVADAAALEALTYEPILTCYLQYPKSLRLASPMVGVDEGCAQWLFDRGRISGQDGLIAAIISARGPHLMEDKDKLLWAIHDDVKRLQGDVPPPKWHRIITEKRATFSCRPGLARPAMRTGVPGLWLCGDYLDPDYPATLESAGRAARRLAEELQRTHPSPPAPLPRAGEGRKSD